LISTESYYLVTWKTNYENKSMEITKFQIIIKSAFFFLVDISYF